MSRRTTKPTLVFGPSSSFHGFTSYETSAFNDVEPAKVIRELIQNSLDAAVEAGEDTAFVRFRVNPVRRTNIPDLAGYEKAFKIAVKFQRGMNQDEKLPDTAQQVVADIEQGLKKVKNRRHHELVVMDNGIGLDNRRMHSVLGNGASAKTEGTGSYGVGHLAAIATSDLRYVLYGAVLVNGNRIAAGNAVLASLPGETDGAGWRASGGYLVKELLNGKNGQFYEFLTGDAIPNTMKSVIDEIESEWGHGTAVIIPAFNHFRTKPDRLWEIVSTVVARNFHVAIFEEKLVVEVDDRRVGTPDCCEDVRRLDGASLPSILESQKEEQRAPRAGSLFSGLRISGQVAYMTHRALSEGQLLSVDTSSGSVEIHLLSPSPSGRTRLDLYRNGMWITQQVPKLDRSDFAGREPFCAVLKVTRRSGELHRLIRKAEGPMHDKLDLKRLSSDESRGLRQAIGEVADRIREVVPERSLEGYVPDDYLVVAEEDNTGGGAKSFSFWGAPEIVQRRTRATAIQVEEDGGGPDPDPDTGTRQGQGPGQGPGPGPGPGLTPTARSSPPLDFRSTAVLDGEGKCAISLVSNRQLEDVVMSLRVDENFDATCDRIGPDEAVRLTSVALREGTGQLSEAPSLFDNGSGVRLQGLDGGVTYELDVMYSIPEGLQESVDTPVFRVELRRIQIKTTER